jgi:hypothetical protein
MPMGWKARNRGKLTLDMASLDAIDLPIGSDCEHANAFLDVLHGTRLEWNLVAIHEKSDE